MSIMYILLQGGPVVSAANVLVQHGLPVAFADVLDERVINSEFPVPFELWPKAVVTKEGKQLVDGSKLRSVTGGCVGVGLEDFLKIVIKSGEKGGVVVCGG